MISCGVWAGKRDGGLKCRKEWEIGIFLNLDADWEFKSKDSKGF
jgi:hypothetical protein